VAARLTRPRPRRRTERFGHNRHDLSSIQATIIGACFRPPGVVAWHHARSPARRHPDLPRAHRSGGPGRLQVEHRTRASASPTTVDELQKEHRARELRDVSHSQLPETERSFVSPALSVLLLVLQTQLTAMRWTASATVDPVQPGARVLFRVRISNNPTRRSTSTAVELETGRRPSRHDCLIGMDRELVPNLGREPTFNLRADADLT